MALLDIPPSDIRGFGRQPETFLQPAPRLRRAAPIENGQLGYEFVHISVLTSGEVALFVKWTGYPFLDGVVKARFANLLSDPPKVTSRGPKSG